MVKSLKPRCACIGVVLWLNTAMSTAIIRNNTNMCCFLILDEDNLPIQGLYGAGDMAVGNLYGDPSNAGGNVHGSMPSGLLAGDSAAAYVKGGCKN